MPEATRAELLEALDLLEVVLGPDEHTGALRRKIEDAPQAAPAPQSADDPPPDPGPQGA